MVSAPDIPGHKVGGVLGTGGFSTVYRAWQIAVGREVAVKVDNRVLLTERDQRRFMREVTAAGRLSGHPHVIDVYNAGTLADGRPYLVMELCPAGSLNDLLHRQGPLNPGRVRDIGVRISDALAAAHGAGVLHRDIKPANILINRYGMVGLSDFGLASIMAAGGEQSASRDALTPAYAPPESFRSEEPTVAGDIYSLAATLYALLAGRPPRFPAGARPPGIATIMDLHGQPVDDVPGVPPELLAVLRSGLAADPAQRPASAVAFRDSLAALPGRPAGPGARPPGPGAPAVVLPGASPQPGGGPPGRSPRAASHRAAAEATTRPTGRPGRRRRGGGRDSGTTVPGHAHRPGAAGRRGSLRAVALAAAFLAVIAGGVVIGVRLWGHGGTARHPGAGAGQQPAVPGVFGVPTVTAGCPAAAVGAAAARCTRDPECWAGLVVTSGSATARSLPCARPHIWQTFAIAILPTVVRTFDQDIVGANSTVNAVCSMPVLLRSRGGAARRIPAKRWVIQVLPPDESAFDSGARAYRCVATVAGATGLRGSEFGS